MAQNSKVITKKVRKFKVRLLSKMVQVTRVIIKMIDLKATVNILGLMETSISVIIKKVTCKAREP
jgi:hypothetical protein